MKKVDNEQLTDNREWKEVKLGDIITLNYGKSLPAKKRCEGNIPVYSSAGCTGSHNIALIEEKGIIVGRKGTVGSVHKVDTAFYCIDTAFYVTQKDSKVDLNYLYYLLKYLPLDKLNSDSAVPGLNRENAYSQKFEIPKLKSEQQKIASILKSLDDKIELNSQMNQTLEEMAQSIFKEWFVEFNFPNEEGVPYKDNGGEMVESELGEIPKGWRVGSIGELTEKLSKGTTPRKSDLSNAVDESEINFLKVKDLNEYGEIIYSGLEKIPCSIHEKQLKRSILKEKDILFSIAGTIGRTAILPKNLNNSNCNQALAFLRLKNTNKYLEFVYYFLKQNSVKSFINSKVVQGVQANVSLKTLSDLMIVIPTDLIMENWNKISAPLLNKNFNNSQENETLIKIRDELLPKLMSGEIRV